MMGKEIGKMKKTRRDRKLQMGVSLLIITIMLSSSIMPGVAMALETRRNQAMWDAVLNTDLTAYQGEATPFAPIEPVEETPVEPPASPADIWFDPGYETNRFIVKYKDAAPVAVAETALKSVNAVEAVERIGIRRSGETLPARAASMAALSTNRVMAKAELEQLLGGDALREIEYIQPDYEMAFYTLEAETEDALEDDIAPEEKQLKDKDALAEGKSLSAVTKPKTLPIPSAGGSGEIVVALLDTGVDTNHPALAGKLVDEWDFVNHIPNVNSVEWYYDQGHGTSLAGTIAAQGATVMPLKIFEGGKAYTSDIISAIAYAEEYGASIANMSFGSRFYNPALEEAMAGSPMLFVCAAGNMLVNIDKYPIYPASFALPNVLAVAAVDGGDKLARFSNYGISGVDMAAPGVDIPVPWLDGATVETSGTSVSAAIVSGGAAQALKAHYHLDAAGLRQRMMESADQVTGLMDKVAGGKRLNIDYAVSAQVGPNTNVIDVPDLDPIPDVMLEGEIEEEYERFGYAELTHMGSNTVNLSGNLSRTYSDLSFDAPGFVINIGRAYNSFDDRVSLISKGWTFSYASKLEIVGVDMVIRLPDGSARSFQIESNGTYTAKDSRAKLIKSGVEYVLTTPDRYQYTYNANGYMYKMTDPNENTVSLTVNASGQVTQVLDPAGRTLTIAYVSNRISTVTESATGRQVIYAYDANGRLSQVTAPDGGNTYYTYDADGLLYQVKNHSSVVLEQFAYETTPQSSGVKRVKSALLPTGNTEAYSYDTQNDKLTTTTGAMSDRITITWFDKDLFPIQVKDVEGGIQQITYNLDGGINRYGEISSSKDRYGDSTFYEYDARGNVKKIVYPNQSVKTMEYDANDLLLSETDERGNKTFYVYDGNRNLTKKARPKDGTTTYTTGANQNLFAIESYAYYTRNEAQTMCGRQIGGLLKTSTDTANFTTTYTYDAQGNLATSKDALNRQTTYSFNVIGWLKQQKSPLGITTTYYYDKCGRLLKKVGHGGEAERYAYDYSGNLTQRIEPKQYTSIADAATWTAQNIVNANATLVNTVGWRYTHTKAGLVETAKDPLNCTASYQYDIYGNKLQETQPNSAVYTYTYDGLNRLSDTFYKEGNTSTKLENRSYSPPTENVMKEKLRVYYSANDYAETFYTYDFAGRLVKQVNPDGGTINKTYLPNGLLAASSDAMGNVTSYEYNPLNRMTKRWSPHDGSLYSLTEWIYDASGRVDQEKGYVTPLAKGAAPSGQAAALAYTYYADSAVKDITINGSGKTAYVYNNDGQVSQETQKQDSARSQRTDYTYHHSGQIKTSTFFVENKDIDGKPDNTTLFGLTTEFFYDANGNVSQVKYPNAEKTDYQYDAMNRRTTTSRTVLNENNAATAVTEVTAYNSMGSITSRKDEKGNYTYYTYNTRGFQTRTTDRMNAVTAYEHDWQGRVVKEYSPRALLQDEPGHVVAPPANGASWASPSAYTAVNYTQFAYDKMGRLLTKTEYYRPTYTSAVRSIVTETNTWDKNGNRLTTKDAVNPATTYTNGNAGRVTSVKNGLNQVTQFTYDGLGRLTQQINAKSVITQNQYDLFGNMTSQTVGGINVMGAAYDYVGNRLTESDGRGNPTTYTYSLAGQVRTVTNAKGYSVRYWYSEMGKNKRSLDTLNKEVVNTYDTWGNLLSVTQRASGGGQAISRSTRYDVLGNPVYVTNERSKTTQYTYDKLSRVIAVKDALNRTSAIAYDANGNQVTETDWRGNVTAWRYDILNRLVNVIDPTDTTVETLTYYDNHLQKTSADALGKVTTFTYDNLGRLLSTKDPLNYVNSQTYDAVGNIATRTDGNNKTTIYNYDGLNRLTGIDSPGSADVSYSYDNAGNVLTQTDGRGNVTRYEYNELNQPVLRADPGGIVGAAYVESRIERYAYYTDGKLQSSRDKNGVTTSYVYDIHGRKTTETTGGAVTSYGYDDAGNLLSVQDAGGAIARTYDALNRVLTKTVPTFGTTTFAYDVTAGLSVGHIGESTTISGRTVTRVYDKAGRLAQVKDGADTTSYAYYANGNLQTQTLPGGITANYTYYDNNKLKTLQNKRGSLTLEAYQYVYDAAGNMTAKQDVKGSTTYTYTDVNQIKTVSEPGGKLTSYTYDASGNRDSETVALGSETTYIYYEVNEQNRLTATAETVNALNAQGKREYYFYDDAGNLVGRCPEAYTAMAAGATARVSLSPLEMESGDLTPAVYAYNNKNQMTEATNGGATVTSVYNAEGLRVSKTAEGVTTSYCYEYSQVIKEIDSAGSAAYNVYGLNLISRDLDGQKAYYLYNGHGDVTALVSSAGVVLASYYYDAFGNILEASGSFGNPYRYAGYTFDDEVRLYYLNARFYDAKIARFMQEDTYLGSKADPLSLNLYTYCRNNPLMYTDRSGHAYMTDAEYRAYAASNNISTSGAWKDTVDQNIINNGGNPSSYSGTSNSSSNSNSSGSSGGTSGWSNSDYYDYATSQGISTAPNSPYADIIDSLLTQDKGFNSFTNVPIYDGGGTMNHSQVTEDTSISYIDTDGGKQTVYVNQDFYIGNDGYLIFTNQEASQIMNHNSNGMFTSVSLGSVSVMIPTAVKNTSGPQSSIVPLRSFAEGFGATVDWLSTYVRNGVTYSESLVTYGDKNPLNVTGVLENNRQMIDPLKLISYFELQYYNRSDAVDYAHDFYDRRNFDYYSYTQDCANFVSQSLFAGGIQMTDDWHSYRDPAFLGSIFGTFNNNNRYNWDVSPAWRQVQDQYDYFSNPSNNYINGEVISLSRLDDFVEAVSKHNIREGDLMYFVEGGKLAHSSIITMVSSDVMDDGIYYSAHTNPRIDYPLYGIIGNQTVNIIRMKDYR